MFEWISIVRLSINNDIPAKQQEVCVMEVVGLILAGGSGSRLQPFTKFTHKTLLPIFDAPVIDYALSTMRRAGIKDITIVANKHIVQISEHIGVGLEGEKIRYVLEERPAGVKNALELAKNWIIGKRVLLYFSDNITNLDLSEDATLFRKSIQPPGAILLVREVDDPGSFGVCVIGEDGEVIDVIEKPKDDLGKLAVGGIYLFDETFYSRIEEMSEKEVFSISDITRQYVDEGRAQIRNIGAKTWIDCGTPESLFFASQLAFEGEISAVVDSRTK